MATEIKSLQWWDHVKITATGAVKSEVCLFGGVLIGHDFINNPIITIYDNTAASGEEMLPTTKYDASALNLNGFVLAPPGMIAKIGIYAEITTAGTCEITILFKRMGEF